MAGPSLRHIGWWRGLPKPIFRNIFNVGPYSKFFLTIIDDNNYLIGSQYLTATSVLNNLTRKR